ncbi:MAG: quinol:cytochrome C oxidoreductase [Planctomycetota bacterium]|jgi:hypothetical protein
MAHAEIQLTDADTKLPAGLAGKSPLFLLVGLATLAAGAAFAFSVGGWKHFQFTYLTAFMTWLTVSLGGMIFLLIHNVFRAGWHVSVRRLAEMVVANFWPWIPIAFLPIFIPIVMGDYALLKWLNPEMLDPTSPAYDSIVANKSAFLNKGFLIARLVTYFTVWALISRFLTGNSIKQDSDGDPKRTRRLEMRSAPLIPIFALTITFAGIDLQMSLDPHWFSTIWGVYLFAGGLGTFMATLGLLTMLVQNFGGMGHVTKEHYHDIGKLMFAFTFFWGYIAFSQYMLIWYANIPEETIYYDLRQTGVWATTSIVLLFGKLLIPFLGLLSRHIKRNRKTLAFWAFWMLFFHFVDHYQIVMPNLAKKLGTPGEMPTPGAELLMWLGMGMTFMSLTLMRAKSQSLVPLRDPRLRESLAFHNI